MKSATIGQFHELIGKLLTGTDYKQMDAAQIQLLIKNPLFAISEFVKFVNCGGVKEIHTYSFPIWKEIVVGGLKNIDLLVMADKDGVNKSLFQSKDLTLNRFEKKYFVKQKVRDFGFTKVPNVDEFYQHLRKLGFKICPSDTAFYVRNELANVSTDEVMFLPIASDVFTLPSDYNKGKVNGHILVANKNLFDSFHVKAHFSHVAMEHGLDTEWIVEVPF